MPLIRQGLVGLGFTMGLAACAPQTGLLLEIQGPAATTSVAAGITDLQLVMARPSYCERWVTDTASSVLRFSVAGHDLDKSPTTILVVPDHETDLTQAVRANVLARNASGQLVGLAAFDAVPFSQGEVLRYSQHVGLLAAGPPELAADGCICVPGHPSVGTSSGTGCDQSLPPSYARLVDTAGCELPAGAGLPLGVCDGQLYPGERGNRDAPCYVASATGCHIGQRVCTDANGQAYASACAVDEKSATLPSSELCDAFATCEATACQDPVPCLRKSAVHHTKLHCTLPMQSMSKDGVAQPCEGEAWATAVGTQTGVACIASMLEDRHVGPVIVGFQQGPSNKATMSATSCPPTLRVDAVNIADPRKLPATLAFAFTLDDLIYDVTLQPIIGCDAVSSGLQCRTD